MAKSKVSFEDKLSWLDDKGFKTDLSIEYLDTGSIILNKLFGGGLPMTKNIQIYSESGYGKSTITISMCKALCQQGHRVLYIDAEGSVNNNLLSTMGIIKADKETGEIDWENTLLYHKEYNRKGNFFFVQLSYFEDIEELLETMIPAYDEKGVPMPSDFRLVVIDSVAALAPKEYRGDMGQKESLSIASQKPGVFAKLMAAFLKKFNGYKTAYNMSFLYINQTREDLSFSYVKQDSIPGGKAMIYYTDVLIKLTSRGVYKKKVITGAGETQDVPSEREIGVTCKKNKITDGNVTLPLQVVFGRGISNIAAMPYVLKKKTIINDKGEEVSMIEGSGAWMNLNIKDKDGKFIQIRCNGQQKLKEAIRDNYPTILASITNDDFKALDEREDYDEL